MKDILVFDSLLSTNLYLQENCIALPNKQIVIAKHQTAGRGRGANCWLDEENTNLLISFLFKEEKDLFLSGLLSLVMGFSLHKTLRKYLANEIKWPNDILVKTKKIAGILIDYKKQENINIFIVGMGVNVNQKNFDSSLQNKATSLYLELRKEIDLKVIQDELIKNVFFEYEKLSMGSFDLSLYKKASFSLGKRILYHNKEYIIKDINSDGALIIQNNKNCLLVNSGEITYFDLPNYYL